MRRLGNEIGGVAAHSRSAPYRCRHKAVLGDWRPYLVVSAATAGLQPFVAAVSLASLLVAGGEPTAGGLDLCMSACMRGLIQACCEYIHVCLQVCVRYANVCMRVCVLVKRTHAYVKSVCVGTCAVCNFLVCACVPVCLCVCVCACVCVCRQL